MKYLPIFDTNIFVDAAKGTISGADWATLCEMRPLKGWPLGWITFVELIDGIHKSRPEGFVEALEPLKLAASLSAGRILEPPQLFIQKKILRLAGESFPISELRNFLSDVCATRDKSRLDTQVRGLSDSHNRRCQSWIDNVIVAMETMDPKWRENRTLNRMPLSSRNHEQVKDTFTLAEWKKVFPAQFGINLKESETQRLADKIEAACRLSFCIFKSILLTDYGFERRVSDFGDFMQLHYLAGNRFCFVTSDKHIAERVGCCPQADRIYSLDRYLASLTS
jgi:hypothetical protein